MPRPIAPAFHEKPWGSSKVEPWFSPRAGLTGEVWFQTEPPLSLLTKFLFTTERLSVQVHPNDRQARARGLANGKTEMWHVLRAEPGSTIALGFHDPVTEEQTRAAALSGAIVELLDWIPVRAGDTFLVGAGTVHAIGAGVAICEIQQNSDTTYRLFDYGRGRSLHLADGLAVSELHPWQPQPPPIALDSTWTRLVATDFFTADLGVVDGPCQLQPAAGYRLLVVAEGRGRLAGQPYAPGECWLVDDGEPSLRIEPDARSRILRTGPTP